MTPITHGMVVGSHVQDSLDRILRTRGQGWVAVIRSIDSIHSKLDLTRVLTHSGVPFEAVNGNCCVSIDTLRKALREHFFSGFDEVWLFEGPPPAFDLAPLPSATSDGADFSSQMPSELARAMKETNCLLIVGDGCGLNYATASPELQKELLNA